MRTTLDVNDHLLKAARRKAMNEGRTLTWVVEEGLRLLLGRSRRSAPPYRLRWVTRRGTEPPEVDAGDRDALYERLDGRR